MSVKVLKTDDTWYGMTYKEDVAAVKKSFREMLEDGVYRAELFADLKQDGAVWGDLTHTAPFQNEYIVYNENIDMPNTNKFRTIETANEM